MSKYGVGIGNVGSYQVSGRPWVTGSTVDNTTVGMNPDGESGEDWYEFPRVTKSIMVTRTGGTEDLFIAWNLQSVAGMHSGKHYWQLTEDNETITFNVKCKAISLYVIAGNADYEMFVELTNIPTSSMPALTGSGFTD